MIEDLKPIHKKQNCICGGQVNPLNDILIFDRNSQKYYHCNCYELLTGKKAECKCLN